MPRSPITPYRLDRRPSNLDAVDEQDEDELSPEMAQVRSSFDGRFYSSSPPRTGSPNSCGSSSPLLSQPTTPYSFGTANSPFFDTPRLGSKSLRRNFISGRTRSNRAIWIAIAVLGTVALAWREQERPVVKSARAQVQRVAIRAKEERCRYMPWLAACPDPFAGLSFVENYGEVIYPATALPSNHSSHSHHSHPSSNSVPSQPHPIHKLIRDAETVWHEKVSRQSRTLEEAVAEYRRRHKIAPPKGFDAWYRFAVANNVSLIDEYDSITRASSPPSSPLASSL